MNAPMNATHTAVTVTDDTLDIPDWLRDHSKQLAYALDNNLDPPDPRFPRTKEEKELRDHNLSCLFERLLDVVSEDLPIIDTPGFAQSGFTQGEVMRWIFSKDERKKRYREAQKIGMEIRQQLLGKIAQGSEMSDVQRDKLEIDTHKWRMERLYREQFGASTSIDINKNVTVDIKALLEKREQALTDIPLPISQGNIYDAE